MAAVLKVLILGACIVMVEASNCQPQGPPGNGLLNCEEKGSKLICHATCKDGYAFSDKQKTRTITCDILSGRWSSVEGFGDCHTYCRFSLLTDTTTGNLSASSVYLNNRELFGSEMSRLTNQNQIWRPAADDITQYLQVSFQTTHRITAVITKGDNVDTYVTKYRILLSMDGVTWYPYKDPDITDRFFRGNNNSFWQQTTNLPCTQISRHVRINPLDWNRHIALKLDLLGCPYKIETNPSMKSNAGECRGIRPPHNGLASCEIQEDQVMCTFTCEKGYAFETIGDVTPKAITRKCDVSIGLYNTGALPGCKEKPSNSSAIPEITNGFCIEGPDDCTDLENGDYQFCGDCHFYATCAEHIFYVRACAAHLKFDSRAKLCDYHSSTCGAKTRRLWKEFTKQYSQDGV